MRHFVVCASQLEAEDGLKVLPFEEDFTFKPIANVDSWREGSLFDDLVYSRSEDEAEILLTHD